MKKINLVLLMILFSFPTFAQVEKEYKDKDKDHMEMMSHDEDATMYSDKMATKLSLNVEQKADLKKAQQKRWESMKELKAGHRAEMTEEDAEDMPQEKAEMHEQRMKIQDDFKEDIREILDDKQFARWEVMHNEEMKMDKEKMMKHKDKSKMKGNKKDHDDDGSEYSGQTH
ncbi:hypothetical protein [Gillisia sp. JM1]|uniref:hypothetical protein n=1 Tax=Gillisia sp. JM1 TaxID=1283286 RepID=UPI0004145B2B|nr:hypothetical protein [Gillisia sp. JM1]